MKTFKFFWTTHKWTGITLAAVFACTAVTGFLLIMKKRIDWVQPPMIKGAAGEMKDFITNQRLFEAVLAQNHPDFQSMEDVDRVDFRPRDRTFKVTSLHNYREMQVCAITGEVLHVDWRPSDMLEDMHDGSYFGEWVHAYVMPIVSIGLLFLVCSGLWLWIEPIVRKRRRRHERRQEPAND